MAMHRHLRAMLRLLCVHDTLTIAVRLDNLLAAQQRHTRYMAIVVTAASSTQTQQQHCCLLGIDHVETDSDERGEEENSANEAGGAATIGLIAPITSTTQIRAEGGGYIVVTTLGDRHVLRPESVQAMWAALQALNAAQRQSPPNWQSIRNRRPDDDLYSNAIQSCDAFRAQWHYSAHLDVQEEDALPPLRADSIERYVQRPAQRAADEAMIRTALKEVMHVVDLDSVTSKDVSLRSFSNLAHPRRSGSSSKRACKCHCPPTRHSSMAPCS